MSDLVWFAVACFAFCVGHGYGHVTTGLYWAGKAKGPMGYRTAVFHGGKFYYVVQEGDREWAKELARG